jgi:polyisoprenoid-binding protein YceI
MKKSIIALAFAAVTGFAFTTDKGKNATTYKVSTNTSTVEWIGKKVTGAHNGLIKLASSELEVKDGMISGGKIVIDMNSITCEDLKGEWSDKLVGHLKSDDFFGVENHKTSELIVKKVSPISGAQSGENNYTIAGDLTIKGITHPIEFPALISVKGDAIAAVGEAKVDRTKYEIKYGSANFFESLGDKAIDNEFSVKFKLAAKK